MKEVIEVQYLMFNDVASLSVIYEILMSSVCCHVCGADIACQSIVVFYFINILIEFIGALRAYGPCRLIICT